MYFKHLGGSGPPVVLLHANGFHADALRPLAAALTARGFTCLAPDLPKHGDAAGDPGPDVAYAAAALAECVRAAGLRGRAFALGHSLGGALALAAEAAEAANVAEAARGDAGGSNSGSNSGSSSGSSSSGSSSGGRSGGGGLFKGVYAYEPVAGPSGSARGDPARQAATAALASLARRRRAVFASPRDAAARLGGKPPFSGFDEAALAAYIEGGLTPRYLPVAAAPAAGELPDDPTGNRTEQQQQQRRQQQRPPPPAVEWVLKCAPEDEARWFEAVGECVPVNPGAVKCPVVIAVGDANGGGGGGGGGGTSSSSGGGGIHTQLPLLGERLAAALPRAELRRFGALSHFGPLESPADVANDAAAFFTRLGLLAAPPPLPSRL